MKKERENGRMGKPDEYFYAYLDDNNRFADQVNGELLEVVAKVKIPEEYKVMKDGTEKFEMCKAFEDYRMEGKEEGKIEGKAEGKQEQLVQMICKKLLKKKPAEVIADELEQDLPEVERVIAAQEKAGSYDVGQICEALAELSGPGMVI